MHLNPARGAYWVFTSPLALAHLPSPDLISESPYTPSQQAPLLRGESLP
jgi:hypothetical protein